MSNSVDITLKSGKNIIVEDFMHISYPSSGKSIIVEKFDDFYLYNRLLTFVGKSLIVTLNSTDIEFIKFNGTFNE